MRDGSKIKWFKFVHQFILRNFFTAVEFFKEVYSKELMVTPDYMGNQQKAVTTNVSI